MKDLGLLLPEIYLIATVIGLVLSESAHHGERVRLILPTALLGLGGAFIQTLVSYQQGAVQLFGGALSLDGFSLYFKLVFLLLASVVVSSACLGEELEGGSRAEFCALVLIGSLALMLAGESANLFVSALSIQAASLVGYLLAGFGRRQHQSAEAAVKWLAVASTSGVFLLLAAMALFIHTGSANIYEVHQRLVLSPPGPAFCLAVFATLFVGLSSAMVAFPSQLWSIDVLQGAPSPAGVFLAAGVRAAGFAVAARLWVVVFSQAALDPGKWLPLGGWDWTLWVAFCAGLSFLMPAFLSLRQTNAKRLLACVALSQTGLLLLGLLILEEVGLAAILFNLVVDLASLAGVSYVLSLGVARSGTAELVGLRGSLRDRPWEAVALLCFSVSWLGLPPFAGSIGKFALIGAAVRREWHVLAVLGLGAMTLTVVSAGRLLLTLLLPSTEKTAGDSRTGPSLAVEQRVFLFCLGVPLVLAPIFADSLLRWASQSLRFIFW